MKVKELRQAYQKTKEANGRSGSELHTCRFYDQLHGILGGDPTTTPPLSVDTCKGGVSHNREEDFVDEEEENVQQANGESILPGSQDLFITVEPIPSKGGIPDPEAGEGTSEITALQQKLLSSEETIQKLLNVIQKKDDLIVQLKHRSHLLTKICRNRPILDNLLSYMAEGEQLSTFPGTQSDSSSPVHDEFQESNCITNQISKNKDFSLCEDDLEDQELDTSQFGTTV
ncbi:Vimentin-type intermediate filament-associated coiled-coil protein [Chelonia mydas]|uniref:Vimentin-type intermediate filament-associated coiled-coil protein n=1 Tax=Chelonia mydas TaxID=8469 RepID=M7BJR4_CHEMY|nr:Vimentin-type intermediate filament-associated coiled-coil protein [Chelonia mydas]